jgi:hypothetical protein
VPLTLSAESLAILLINRSFVHRSLGAVEKARSDAIRALELDPGNVIALSYFPELAPAKPAALKTEEKTVAEVSDPPPEIEIEAPTVVAEIEATEEKVTARAPVYTGPFTLDLSNFNEETVRALIQLMKTERLPSRSDVIAILDRTCAIHEPLPNIVAIKFPEIKVVGDTHGQFQDLLYIFDTFGFPSETNPYLFNGDYVDRGSQGLEIVLTLFAMKIANPGAIFLNRGNQFV